MQPNEQLDKIERDLEVAKAILNLLRDAIMDGKIHCDPNDDLEIEQVTIDKDGSLRRVKF